ncbi:MAG: DEAD/DEAH box helicase family protein [Flavobacteriales bacterium]|nr:DEAD/DEAH box helicase family protein [Flavobacteriales bacterium]
MKIQFESALPHQQAAIRSIVDIFQGQEKCESNFTVYSPEFLAKSRAMEFTETGYGNRLLLGDRKLLENVQKIQLANGLKPSASSEVDRKALDFTVEMETGTGKTYVYLRTIMELYKRYGFSKHIIVVPSIPIKEGVYKSLQMTESHFRELYDNINYNYFVYDSSDLPDVRDFATNAGLEIMVINIDAFRRSFQDPLNEKKKENIIHRYNDSLGYKPLDLIANTSPIVFVDEPQRAMNTDLAKKAVKGLNPMAVIRFSATHKEIVNLMYKLNAVDAYEQKLVKQIEVGSVTAQGVNNQTYIKFVKVNLRQGMPTAQLELAVFEKGEVKRKKLTVSKGINGDLEERTGRNEYEGFIIEDIHAVPGEEYISFTGRDEVIKLGAAIGDVDDSQVRTALIRKTIEEHLDKELVYNPQGIKVLSLFFIDKVANYRQYDEEGNKANGPYAVIFEREYKRFMRLPKYVSLFGEITDAEVAAHEVHDGYFSIDKRSKASNKKDRYEAYKDTTGKSDADEDTYSLIMRDKEKLLSFESKLRFIFSHSALREGWDNPNVFQICTLKDAGSSDVGRRQEIGRGLRLCVDQHGDRVHGQETNILTVMATESYVDFVKNLQKEIEKETGIVFGRLESHSFNNVVLAIDGDDIHYLGQARSEALFGYLIRKGYINAQGKVQDLLRTDLKEDQLSLPEEFTEDLHVYHQLLSKLKDAAGKLEIKDQSDRKRVQLNKHILASPEFRELWERVKYKTTFSVAFDSDKLVAECTRALDDRLRVSRGKLIYTKVDISMTIGGLVAEEQGTYVAALDEEVEVLPDIVTYIQNETQLTRKSIVKILTGTNKLGFFKVNPQKFIEGCIDIINEQMRLHIVDGIQYKKIGDAEFYSQELFKNEELFGYLKSNLQESRKSPLEHVIYDSAVESRLALEFEKSANISVYTKLPNWFKIDTPLGTYNPDWAVLWKNDNEEKLFFVVETKGGTGLFDMRPKERGKIDCGKQHFKAIGTELIEVSEMAGVEEFGLKESRSF